MKTKLFLALILIPAILCSCSTLSGRIKSAVTGYPLWYYESSVISEDSEKTFTVYAQSESQRQAELLAYDKLEEEISSYLGYGISQEDYRELVTLGTISKYNLKISDTSTVLKNGMYLVFLFAKADYEGLQAFRTRSAVELESKSDQIINLILEGDSCIKNNEDLNGVALYLKSMALSYGLDGLENQYSYESIKKEVIDILQTMKIKMEGYDSSKVTAQLHVQRKESVIASDVVSCKVKAVYLSVDGRGNEYPDSFSYTTDRYGHISFRIFNNAVVKKGSVKFSFDLTEELNALESKDSSTAAVIRKIIEASAVSFDYERVYSLGTIGVCVLCYNIDAEPADSSDFTKQLCSMIESDGLACVSIQNAENLSDEQIAERLFSSGAGCALILRAGAYDYQNSETGICSVSMQGEMVFRDRNGKNIYSSEIFYSNGFGENFKDAESKAFENLFRTVYTLLKASYV